jgi:hypothetical protein
VPIGTAVDCGLTFPPMDPVELETLISMFTESGLAKLKRGRCEYQGYVTSVKIGSIAIPQSLSSHSGT